MDISSYNVRDYLAATLALFIWLAAMISLRFILDNWFLGIVLGSVIGLVNAWAMSRWFWPVETETRTERNDSSA